MSKKRTMRKGRIASFVRLLVLGGVLCITLVTFLGQQKQLTDLNKEHKLLEEKLAQLKLEEEKRKRLLDFTQTNEYKERFARDKLGLVKKDDIKFVAPTPTPAPVTPVENPPTNTQEGASTEYTQAGGDGASPAPSP